MTNDEIQDCYKKLGLETDTQRTKFSNFEVAAPTINQSKGQVFIKLSSATEAVPPKEAANAQLERRLTGIRESR